MPDPLPPVLFSRCAADHWIMRLRLIVEGMLSVHASRALYTALAGVKGVERADVRMGIAIIDADATVREADLRAAASDVGLTVTSITRELPVV
jgi:hypothetical protein